MVKQIRGQVGLSDAPSIVLIIGLVFLVMATIAFIGEKYGDAIPSSKTATSVNESVTQAERDTGSGYTLDNVSLCNSEDFTVVLAINATGGAIPSTNYSVSSTGLLTNKTGDLITGTWRVTYTTKYAGTACEVNKDLGTNISENTSIAGIVLTISLVGIVLSVLVGVFIGIRRQRI